MTDRTPTAEDPPQSVNMVASSSESRLPSVALEQDCTTSTEEKLSKALLDTVLPPFRKCIKLQALVVYQADQEKMNCLLIDKQFERSDNVQELQAMTSSSVVDTVANNSIEHFSDSGFMEPTFINEPTDSMDASPQSLTQLVNGPPMTEVVDTSLDNLEQASRRKRKLLRPCKIPQNGTCSLSSSSSSASSTTTLSMSMKTEFPQRLAAPLSIAHPNITTTTSATTSTTFSTVNYIPGGLSFNGLNGISQISSTSSVVPVIKSDSTERLTDMSSHSSPVKAVVVPQSAMPSISQEAAPQLPAAVGHNGISEGVILPVTLFSRMNVFSLPVTVLSTLPRPILPRSVPVTNNGTIAVSSATANTIAIPSSGQGHQSSSIAAASSSSSSQAISLPSLDRRPSPKVTPNSSEPMKYNSSSGNNSRRFNKSFNCNQCHKEFFSLNLLCQHTFATHRCFRCTICKAQFTQRSNLQRHSLRHVGFKPFICKVCGKSYYRKDHLVRHIELSHPGCDPRTNLTVKLTSAECLEYLDRMQKLPEASRADEDDRSSEPLEQTSPKSESPTTSAPITSPQTPTSSGVKVSTPVMDNPDNSDCCNNNNSSSNNNNNGNNGFVLIKPTPPETHNAVSLS